MALEILDYLGVFVFAVSGALVAIRKQMDIFGLVVMALMPAVGGGTLRDLLLDAPVFWIVNNEYLLITIAAALFTFAAHRLVHNATKLMVWADAIGLSVFCVVGCAKALAYETSALVAIIMGVMTAVAGGILRDVIANDVPYILQKEIYATAALVGAFVFWVMQGVSGEFATWVGIAAALVVRGLGITLGWRLPQGG